MLYFILSFLLLIFVISTCFLAKELLKKFKYWKIFQKEYKNQISWVYQGDTLPGMYTFRLQGNKAFRALIGFDFSIGLIHNMGYDIFGSMESDEDGSLYFSVYLRHVPVEFIYLIDGANATDISISCIDTGNSVMPKYVYLPHWWQRLGFIG